MLTAYRLRQLVSYDTDTGLFTCIVPRKNRSVGDVETKIAGHGYIAFCVDGKQYTAHRLAWLYVNGEFPKGEIDHANGDKADNRMANLRLASRGQNAANTRLRCDNSIGLKGVFKNKKRWSAQIQSNGRVFHLGTFDSPEEAHSAYCKAAAEIHGQFARAA